MSATPSALGYRFPAEWEPHARTWMAWPERPDNWREGAGPARAAYRDVAAAISRFEPVTVVASPNGLAGAKQDLSSLPNVTVVEAPLDDAWMRDIGPTFLVRGGPEGARAAGQEGAASGGAPDNLPALAGVDWTFNAWGGLEGGLYHPWDNDDAIAARVLGWAGARRFRTSYVCEGGSIHVDGEGTLLATRECLLNRNRNPDLSVDEVVEALRSHLGVTKVVWIPRGSAHDTDTDGHVDNIACFASPGHVVLSWEDDPGTEQGRRCREAEEALLSATDARGRRIRVTRLPVPNPELCYSEEETAGVLSVPGTEPREAGVPLSANYVNFYVCNGGVICPQFGCPEADARAVDVLRSVFPDREVVPVQTREILLGGGNIHCITQQQPSVPGTEPLSSNL